MCGIFFSLSRHGHIAPDADTAALLRNRGPDRCNQHDMVIRHQDVSLHATFVSTVLSLRGSAVVDQPLVQQDARHVLCWNGEAWSMGGQPISGNDSSAVLDALAQSRMMHVDRQVTAAHTVKVLSSIRGPYALVYYDATSNYIFYGRDCLGRRSLLRKTTADDDFTLSSVCVNSSGDRWAEVEADGIYMLDLEATSGRALQNPIRIPHLRRGEERVHGLGFVGKSSFSRILLKLAGNSLSLHGLLFP